MQNLNASNDNYYWSDESMDSSTKANPRHDAWFVFVLAQMDRNQREQFGTHGNNNPTEVVKQYNAVVRKLITSTDMKSSHERKAKFEEWLSIHWKGLI